ncbi:hypothetical protein F2P81_004091 [Scophthalmus maximus]|uniref:Uncharacterized protein n=1 Tax=Scophthalmus maximus TaxID=52904 RepID=A0A6A4THP5_SCOMX|nr:hypothetical protein F2P81_004091 [Scophthalmus maximus]
MTQSATSNQFTLRCQTNFEIREEQCGRLVRTRRRYLTEGFTSKVTTCDETQLLTPIDGAGLTRQQREDGGSFEPDDVPSASATRPASGPTRTQRDQIACLP